jgi:WD repeat-containing protein 19
MRCLDVSLAIRAFRAVGDAGTVMALQRVDGLEDVHLLSGHLALIFDDHATAQDHFLQSARPLAALDMRRDLMHWEQALKLAKTLAADQAPSPPAGNGPCARRTLRPPIP